MNRTIVALDFNNADSARTLVRALGPASDFYKIGMELYAAEGPSLVRELVAAGKRVFLDLKLYDIGETVKRATRHICQTISPALLTVHGNRTVMEAATDGRGSASTKILAVTVLTSFDAEDLRDLGYPCNISELVEHRVRGAMAAGLDGVVCSPLEASRVRQIVCAEKTIVTPGVRSPGIHSGDQKRVATPAEALQSGADYVVVGREITRADHPREAFERLTAELPV